MNKNPRDRNRFRRNLRPNSSDPRRANSKCPPYRIHEWRISSTVTRSCSKSTRTGFEIAKFNASTLHGTGMVHGIARGPVAPLLNSIMRGNKSALIHSLGYNAHDFASPPLHHAHRNQLLGSRSALANLLLCTQGRHCQTICSMCAHVGHDYRAASVVGSMYIVSDIITWTK